MKHLEYVEILKDFGKDALKKALIKGLVRQLPLLAAGPLNLLTVKFATWLAQQIAEEAEIGIFFRYIDFRSDMQAQDFEDAMIKNHTIQRIGTNEEKILAEKALADALRKLAFLRL